jgi:hypothetical protein
MHRSARHWASLPLTLSLWSCSKLGSVTASPCDVLIIIIRRLGINSPRCANLFRIFKISSAFVFRVLQLTHCHYLQLLTDPTIKSLAEEFLREFRDVDYELFSADIVLNAKKPVA